MKANELVSKEFVRKLKELEKREPANFKVQKTATWTYNKFAMLQKELREHKSIYPNYKQGSIVFVDFGVNVGNEFSGPHFAVVLNKHDSNKSSLFTVLPLTSKNNKKNIELGSKIFEEVAKKQKDSIIEFSRRSEKIDNSRKEIDDLIDELQMLHYDEGSKDYISKKMKAILKEMYPEKEFKIENQMQYTATKQHIISHMIADADAQIKSLSEDISLSMSVIKHYEKHEKSSYGIIGSITTISKDRIIVPINKFDPIGRISISVEEIRMISSAFNSKFI